MAAAILDGRDMRCSLERALHGVDVMLAVLRSGEEKRFIDIETRCTRPEALDVAAAEALLRQAGNTKSGRQTDFASLLPSDRRLF